MSDLKENVILAPYTTLSVGGPAARFAVAKNDADMIALADLSRQRGLSLLVLGGGSNVLIADAGFSGLVIKNEIHGIASPVFESQSQVLVTVGAGENWDDFVSMTVSEGWWGIENLSGIPGTVGATPIQNVGAYGVEVAEVIESVRVLHVTTGSIKDMPAHECGFGYRDSFFKTPAGKEFIILSVTFRLSLVASPKLHYKDLAARFADQGSETANLVEIRNAVLEIRRGKFPDWTQVGTAGSFFKNPIITVVAAAALRAQYPELPIYPDKDGYAKVSLGYILDRVCNLRGYRVGDVGLYEKQALVLVNFGNATAADVKTFADEVSDKVFLKTKIKIETEVRFV